MQELTTSLSVSPQLQWASAAPQSVALLLFMSWLNLSSVLGAMPSRSEGTSQRQHHFPSPWHQSYLGQGKRVRAVPGPLGELGFSVGLEHAPVSSCWQKWDRNSHAPKK